MDGVFRMVQAHAPNLEIYLLDDWGKAVPEAVEDWVACVKTGVEVYSASDDPPQKTLPVCSYDLRNLEWSGKSILASVDLTLWEELEKELPYRPSGPEVFAAVVTKIQQVNASAVRGFSSRGLSRPPLV